MLKHTFLYLGYKYRNSRGVVRSKYMRNGKVLTYVARSKGKSVKGRKKENGRY